MSTAEITQWIATPRFKAALVVAYYLFTILTGAFVLFFHGRMALEADAAVSVFYIGATALLYGLSGPVSGKKER